MSSQSAYKDIKHVPAGDWFKQQESGLRMNRGKEENVFVWSCTQNDCSKKFTCLSDKNAQKQRLAVIKHLKDEHKYSEEAAFKEVSYGGRGAGVAAALRKLPPEKLQERTAAAVKVRMDNEAENPELKKLRYQRIHGTRKKRTKEQLQAETNKRLATFRANPENAGFSSPAEMMNSTESQVQRQRTYIVNNAKKRGVEAKMPDIKCIADPYCTRLLSRKKEAFWHSLTCPTAAEKHGKKDMTAEQWRQHVAERYGRKLVPAAVRDEAKSRGVNLQRYVNSRPACGPRSDVDSDLDDDWPSLPAKSAAAAAKAAAVAADAAKDD